MPCQEKGKMNRFYEKKTMDCYTYWLSKHRILYNRNFGPKDFCSHCDEYWKKIQETKDFYHQLVSEHGKEKMLALLSLFMDPSDIFNSEEWGCPHCGFTDEGDEWYLSFPIAESRREEMEENGRLVTPTWCICRKCGHETIENMWEEI